MRAILHGAFTTGLAQYCFDRNLEHPGFVILDSPLITYRGPDPEVIVGQEDDELMTVTVGQALFRHLNEHFDGQAIVIENTDPPSGLDGAVTIKFTKVLDSGRYGFFPVHERS
ncbi:hypothetical protein GCM10009662_11190 [Catellatospora coxensis]|uniref:Uncharacterized protein n=2 Tax=Catellatospora coxensis TaxID=310354 RepID=A0A8J3LA85_9ACTN|nr:hypothetical protein Cco03nite_75850 [Catellatospora coxensis]